MKDDEVICTIKWTVADVRSAFVNEHGRQPTDDELQECVDNLDVSVLEEVSIERGWSIIKEVIN